MARLSDDLLGAIRARLGDDATECRVRSADREWVAYRAPARSERSKPLTAALARDYYAAQQRELADLAADDGLRAANVRHFVGDGGTTIWAIPELAPIDVVEAARVGTHDGRDDAWMSVRALLRATIARPGFDVVFADEAGLDARLAGPVDVSDAIAWDSAILDRIEAGERLADSYGFMLDRASGLAPVAGADPRGGGLVPAFIVATRSLRLWWD